MVRTSRAGQAIGLCILLTAGFGCELITAPDRSLLNQGTGGQGATGGAGAEGGLGAEGGTGGLGGEGGVGGMGGDGGRGACDVPEDCGTPPECVANTCVDSVCGTVPLASGTIVDRQTAGDCHVNQCDGAGNVESVVDNGDEPDDANGCTDDICDLGMPSHPPLPANTPCSRNGGALCDGAGACVGCLVADDCPGQDTECQTRTCDAGVCGVDNADQGTQLASQTVGDCLVDQCDGAGGVESVPDDADVEDDGNDCTDDSCDNGSPVHANTAADTPCGVGGALLCDGAGSCVGCLDAEDCGTPSNQCLDAVCNAGTCGTEDKMDGTACDDGTACSQTDTCQSGACTGSNPVICTASDQCHDVGVCDPGTGVCSNPNSPDGSVCDDGDACTQTDTCQTGTCTGSNPVSCTASDQCHDVGVCDPATGVCSNPNATDGTSCDDGSACTQTDTCQTGTCTGANPVMCTPLDECHIAGVCDGGTGACSNPNAPDGTPCTGGACAAGVCVAASCSDGVQNGDETGLDCGGGTCPTCPNGQGCAGGTDCQSGLCDGNVCVQCIAPTDCPGSDTDCQTRTCTANVCGVDFAGAGTATSNQTIGDCQEEQCDGSGGTVSADDDTDVPVDDGNQCTGEVCNAGVPEHPEHPFGTVCSQNGGTTCDGAGACVAPPEVASTDPANAATGAPVTSAIAVVFTNPMNPATLTAQTVGGNCTGSVQVSSDEFVTCLGMSAAAPVMSGGNTTATWTPSPAMSFGTVYKIRVLDTVADALGLPLGATFTTATGFTTAVDFTSGPSVVISEVYGGGGNTGALYQRDFIELHNRGPVAVDIGGWSVQFINATGTGTWAVRTIPGGTVLAAGGYFLIEEGAGAGNGAPLPTPDLAGGTFAMGATSGKVALVSNTTALTGACPSLPAIQDLVGFGTTANCFEGSGPTPAPSNSTSVQRRSAGCQDSDDNAADFEALAPVPQNSASAAVVCSVSVNEQGVAAELDFCNVQFPASISVQTATAMPTIYAQAFEAGVTEAAGAAPGLRAQIGYGPLTANPQSQAGWSWFDATFNVDAGNNDEWQADLTAPAPGDYSYGARFSFDGVQWTYCDLNGAGSNGSLAFEILQLAPLTVTP